MPRRPSAFVCAVLALAAGHAISSAGVAARAGDRANNRAGDARVDSVDVEVPATTSVRGTIRSARERETFVLSLPEGAVVKATALRRGRGKLVPALDLLGQLGALAAGIRTTPRGATLTSLPVTLSGLHRLRVQGDGAEDGDYQLRIAAQPRRTWSGSGAGSGSFRFAAPAGAEVSIRVAPADGSGFVPALEVLADGTGNAVETLAGGATARMRVGATGAYSVRFRDASATGGRWTCRVTLRIPRASKTTLDVSAAALTGAFVDHQSVFGRRAGDGAALDLTSDPNGPLAGASVTLDPGSLVVPACLHIAEAAAIALPAGQRAAGPTIRVGPRGTHTAEGKPAHVSLPIGTSVAQDDVAVFTRNEATGAVTQIPGPYEFPAPGIVRIAAAGSGDFAAATRGPAPLDGEWVLLDAEVEPQADHGGSFVLESGVVTFDGASWSLSGRGPRSTWVRAPEPHATFAADFGFDLGLAVADGADDVLLQGARGESRMRRSLRGDVLLRVPSTDDPEARVTALLRRTRGDPTPTTVSGRWHVIVLGLSARPETGPGGGPRVRLGAEQGRGTAVLSPEGRVQFIGVSTKHAESTYPDGTWTSRPSALQGTGSYSVAPGEVGLTLPGSVVSATQPDVRLRACVGGDVLIGVSNPLSPASGESVLYVLVRESNGARAGSLRGDALTAGLMVAPHDAPPGVQDFDLSATSVQATFNGSRSVVRDASSDVLLGHDADGAPTVAAGSTPGGKSVYTVGRNGLVRLAGGRSGALARSGGVLVGGGSDGRRFELFVQVPVASALTASAISPR